jgi:hypothetical protein
MTNMTATNYRKDIPQYSGDLDDNLTFEEWIKKANTVAREAGWTDAQKLQYYQTKLIGAAFSYNNTLTVNQKATYIAWVQAMDEGFNDASIQNMRKAQLSKIEQTTKERVRDFKTRIDDLYKSAYGRDAAASQDAAVVRLRGSLKKEVFLRGIRLNIRKILWSKLEMDDTFEMIVAKAQNCEHAVDLQRETEESEPHKRLEKENNEKNIRETEFQQIMKALANVQLSAQNVGAASGTVAQISTEEQQEPRRSVRFADRTRSYSPFPRDSYSRSRELIIPRDRSYSPGRQRYESSDREQYRRPQSTDKQRDGSRNWDKNRSYVYRSYPPGSNERISNRGETNSRPVSPGLNRSYSQTREEYSQA